MDRQELIALAEKVDQDVREAAADYADEHIRMLGLGDDIIAGKKDDTGLVQAIARMKEAGRQQGLREAAAKCLEMSGWIGAAHGSSIDSALREASTAITALMEGEGK